MNCPDYSVAPHTAHRDYCDTAHCPDTGTQRTICDHDGTCTSIWSGDFVGAECRAWDWWLIDDPDLGLVPCPPDTKEAIEDTSAPTPAGIPPPRPTYAAEARHRRQLLAAEPLEA